MKHLGLSVVALAAVAAASQAAVIEYVKVSSTVGGAIGGGGNTLTYSSVNGLSSQGTANPPSVIQQSASSNTNQLDQTSASVGLQSTLVNGFQTYDVDAFAGADLATGAISLLSSSHLISGTPPPVNGLAVSSGVLRDQVTFFNSNPGATAIDVYFSLDGTLAYGASGSVGLDLRFCLGVACNLAGNTVLSDMLQYQFYDNSAFLPDGNYVHLPTTGWASVSLTPGNDPSNEVFHGVYMVPTGQSTVDLYAGISLNCRFDATCDYLHTGQMSWNLAPGVTANSASSVLLTAQAVEGVPEPGSWLLLASGAVLLAIGRRVRGRQA
jgi:hypothetical protein